MIDADALKHELDVRGIIEVYGTQVNLAIDGMRTIEERKTGRWEERQVSDDKCIEEWQSARCSVCGKYHTTPYMYCFDDYNFCPNCGADMRTAKCGTKIDLCVMDEVGGGA